ncbi:hypothetical protein V502_02988, partial [Pseudogymnoascus sp. VKM F-4520 (FW-2644)]
MGCLNDDAFGPTVRGCWDDFDFTQKFERILFSAVPASIFILLAIVRVFHLAQKPRLVLATPFRLVKILTITAAIALCYIYVAYEVALCIERCAIAADPNAVISFSRMDDLIFRDSELVLWNPQDWTSRSKFRASSVGIASTVSGNCPMMVVIPADNETQGSTRMLSEYPIASDLCTRHATQIVLHRNPETSVKVSIIPGPSVNGNESHKLKLESFAKFLGEKFRAEEFKAILDEAAVHMGLPGPNNDIEDLEKRFSDDILKIELSGPHHTNLSVVDVPGLFHNPTKYQTEEDKAII